MHSNLFNNSEENKDECTEGFLNIKILMFLHMLLLIVRCLARRKSNQQLVGNSSMRNKEGAKPRTFHTKT